MCGIVGFIGNEQAAPILLEGLSRLEYRGYDSAGVAVFDGETGTLAVHKAKGRLQVLSDQLHGGADLNSTVGVGHTRWATHGAPSDVNSHPQVSRSGRIAVVHNGIIENYAELKAFLVAQGVPFTSETDTEVVAQLIEYFYEGDLLAAVSRVLHRIEGAYALGILCADCPEQIIAVRKDGPLILGYSQEGSFIASDVTAILRHTRQVSYMEDGEVAVLTRDGIRCYNRLMQPVEKEIVTVDWEINDAEKGGYEHFMFKEIMEQPDAIRRCISPRIREGEVVFEDFSLSENFIKAMRRIYIVACGSSYHVGMVGKYHLERLTRIPVEVALGSEFRYMDPIVDENTLVIVISQSGETADTLAALKEAKKAGAPCVSITNVLGSGLARQSDAALYTCAGPEIAVASTKAYTTQLVLLAAMVLKLADLYGADVPDRTRFLQDLAHMPEAAQKMLDMETPEISHAADSLTNLRDAYFIGRQLDYVSVLEGALKLKEISYIHADAYYAGELKHGPIALIEEGTVVIALATQPEVAGKTISNIQETMARGADVTLITGPSETADGFSQVLRIPDVHPYLAVIPVTILLQKLAFEAAVNKGCDVDKPRNLAKSVTVE